MACVEAAVALDAALSQRAEEGRPVFVVSLEFSSTASLPRLFFSPARADFLGGADAALLGIAAVAANAPRLLYNRAFKHHVEPDVFSGGGAAASTLAATISAAAAFSAARAHLLAAMNEHFDAAAEYSAQFAPLAVIASFVRHWSSAAYASQISSKPAQTFADDMGRLSKWVAQLERVRLLWAHGLLQAPERARPSPRLSAGRRLRGTALAPVARGQVETKALRGVLLPGVSGALAELKERRRGGKGPPLPLRPA